MIKLVYYGIYVLVLCIIVKIVDKIFKHIGKKTDAIHIRYLRSITKGVILFLGIYGLLSRFEFTKEFSKTVLTSGGLIVALITYSAQKSIGNIVSGLTISMSKPFEVGDKISVKAVGGVTPYVSGRVETMTIHYVKIREYNGDIDIIPNSVIDQSIVTNTDITNIVRYQDTVMVAYGSDYDLVEDTIRKILYDNELTINNDENTMIECILQDSGVQFRYTVVSEDINVSYLARSSVAKDILKEFERRGIVIPYNTVTISNN